MAVWGREGEWLRGDGIPSEVSYGEILSEGNLLGFFPRKIEVGAVGRRRKVTVTEGELLSASLHF